jgi:hypothetical protein
MYKLKRAFQSQNITINCVVFIRNDVYENLVDATPDRGKIARILVDWTDPQLLLELLRRRFLSSGIKNNPPFENIWRALCVSHIGVEESAHYMIDRCLMRPRALIEFIKFCRGHAVNLGKQKIGVEDIEQGEEQYSTQLVNDICYEIQDVCPSAKDILYEFIECPSELDDTGMRSILERATSNSDEQDRIIDLLLWYGVIGFLRDDGKPTFIYSVRYDTRRLKALLKKRDIDSITYVINPAFWKGLEIKT